jgi:hypothetical protein
VLADSDQVATPHHVDGLISPRCLSSAPRPTWPGTFVSRQSQAKRIRTASHQLVNTLYTADQHSYFANHTSCTGSGYRVLLERTIAN